MSDTFEIDTGSEPVNQILRSVWSYAGKAVELADATQNGLSQMMAMYDQYLAELLELKNALLAIKEAIKQ